MNQLPAGVTMVTIKGKYAAIRVRPGRGADPVALRTEPDGGFEPLWITGVRRAKRPWCVRIESADAGAVPTALPAKGGEPSKGALTSLVLRPCLPSEADIRKVGKPAAGIGNTSKLGEDPISAIIAVFAILFYVLASPFFAAAAWSRTKVARSLQGELEAASRRPSP
jgi:hypothetical protein